KPTLKNDSKKTTSVVQNAKQKNEMKCLKYSSGKVTGHAQTYYSDGMNKTGILYDLVEGMVEVVK
ncbi:8482_t:CDS:2, partial [Ambispora gerdemannii]